MSAEEIRRSRIEIVGTVHFGGAQSRILLEGVGRVTLGTRLGFSQPERPWSDEVFEVTGQEAELLEDLFQLAMRDGLFLLDDRSEFAFEGSKRVISLDLAGRRNRFTLDNANHSVLEEFDRRLLALIEVLRES